jgi:hypothetical protein
MSLVQIVHEPTPPPPPVARWLSIDELHLAARRDSEKHALRFCESLISAGNLDTITRQASDLRNSN